MTKGFKAAGYAPELFIGGQLYQADKKTPINEWNSPTHWTTMKGENNPNAQHTLKNGDKFTGYEIYEFPKDYDVIYFASYDDDWIEYNIK